MFQAFPKNKLGKHHSAIAKDHNKNTEPSSCVANGDFSTVSKVNLGVLAGFERQRQIGRFFPRAQGAYQFLYTRVPALIPLFFDQMKNLRSAVIRISV